MKLTILATAKGFIFRSDLHHTPLVYDTLEKYQLQFWVHFSHFILQLLEKSSIFLWQIWMAIGCTTCQFPPFRPNL